MSPLSDNPSNRQVNPLGRFRYRVGIACYFKKAILMLSMTVFICFLAISLASCSIGFSNAATDPTTTFTPTVQTATAIEIEQPIRTNTPNPTHTSPLQSTPSPRPSVTDTINSTSTITSPVEIVNPETELPERSSALLFISDQGLMRWDPFTNFVSPISENVLEYSVSRSGRLVALLRSRNMVANGIGMYELSLLDLDSKQITPLINQTSRLYSLSISPNGEWIAYYPQKNGGRLNLIRSDGSDETLELGFCHQELNIACEPVSWSADNRAVLWSDQRGLWLAYLDWESPRLISNNTIEYTDPAGVTSTIQVAFNSISWSPLGRYALAEIVPSTSLTRWYGVIDTRREEIIEVPESFQAGTHAQNTIWLSDGLLAVGKIHETEGEITIQITIYEVVPTHPGIFLLNREIQLYPEDGFIAPALSQIPNTNIDWMAQPNPLFPDLFFGIRNQLGVASPTLYQLEIEDEALQYLNPIPQSSVMVLWAVDLSGALIVGDNQDYYYLPIMGDEIQPLSQVFGKDAVNFTWLPPSQR